MEQELLVTLRAGDGGGDDAVDFQSQRGALLDDGGDRLLPRLFPVDDA
ncbi:MAG: hypothetical protein HQL77_15670 [Magnetococcales bacterium]|nr:hypothetical protein [Magnetococcales bacterium]